MFMFTLMLAVLCWTFLGLIAWSMAIYGAAGPAKLFGMAMEIKKRLMK